MLRLKFDLWLPATMAPALLNGSRELDQRTVRGYTATGLLAPGTTRAQAQSDVDVAMRQLSQEYPETNATLQGEVLPFWQFSRGPQRFLATALAFLQAIMLLLLVAVCGNTANLMLARASARQREMGMRLALGAGPWRIVRLLLAENMMLALAGAGARRRDRGLGDAGAGRDAPDHRPADQLRDRTSTWSDSPSRWRLASRAARSSARRRPFSWRGSIRSWRSAPARRPTAAARCATR